MEENKNHANCPPLSLEDAPSDCPDYNNMIESVKFYPASKTAFIGNDFLGFYEIEKETQRVKVTIDLNVKCVGFDYMNQPLIIDNSDKGNVMLVSDAKPVIQYISLMKEDFNGLVEATDMVKNG